MELKPVLDACSKPTVEKAIETNKVRWLPVGDFSFEVGICVCMSTLTSFLVFSIFEKKEREVWGKREEPISVGRKDSIRDRGGCRYWLRLFRSADRV